MVEPAEALREDTADSVWENRTWLGATPRSLLVDSSGLKVRRPFSETLRGQPGYRPALLVLAAVFLVAMLLVPLPGSLIDLVEQANPPGYAMAGPDTETIVDSANYLKHPEAFEVWKEDGGLAREAKGLDSSEQVARRAMMMLGILFVAALFWGAEALPQVDPIIRTAVRLK